MITYLRRRLRATLHGHSDRGFPSSLIKTYAIQLKLVKETWRLVSSTLLKYQDAVRAVKYVLVLRVEISLTYVVIFLRQNQYIVSVPYSFTYRDFSIIQRNDSSSFRKLWQDIHHYLDAGKVFFSHLY